MKGEIIKHRSDKRGPTTGEAEEDNVQVILEQASYELKHGDPEVALLYVAKVVKLQPENNNALVLQTKCLLRANKFKETLDSADQLLSHCFDQKPSDVAEVLIYKGDALYHMGSFEHALVNYYRAVAVAAIGKTREILARRLKVR